STSVRYLMGESVSLFEWGIFRLQTTAENFGWDDLEVAHKHLATVKYDWTKNQVTVTVIVYPSYRSLQKTNAKGVCGSVMRQMKSNFGVSPGFEWVRSMSGVGTFFHPQHFLRNDEPKTIDADLEAITNLEVWVHASKNDQAPYPELISCSSELL